MVLNKVLVLDKTLSSMSAGGASVVSISGVSFNLPPLFRAFLLAEGPTSRRLYAFSSCERKTLSKTSLGGASEYSSYIPWYGLLSS